MAAIQYSQQPTITTHFWFPFILTNLLQQYEYPEGAQVTILNNLRNTVTSVLYAHDMAVIERSLQVVGEVIQ